MKWFLRNTSTQTRLAYVVGAALIIYLLFAPHRDVLIVADLILPFLAWFLIFAGIINIVLIVRKLIEGILAEFDRTDPGPQLPDNWPYHDDPQHLGDKTDTI